MNVWLKFCGLCEVNDLAYAVALRAHAAGVIRVPSSPRNVNDDELAALAAYPRGTSKLVVVLQDPTEELVRESIGIALPDALQFHGSEPPEFCTKFGLPYIKAVRGREHISLLHVHDDATAWLIDDPEYMRNELLQASSPPLILAGGLNPENVRQRIHDVRPFGVDVARGIELHPRKKDPQKMLAFQRAIASMDTK